MNNIRLENKMRDAFLFLKLLKGLCSFACMLLHVIGFRYELEPMPHELFCCGTSFTGLLISVSGITAILLKFHIQILMEAIISFAAFSLFIFFSFVSMYHCENDFHMMYLTDVEEAKHYFFKLSRIQSCILLFAGYLFLMHGMFCIDMLMIPTKNENVEEIDAKTDTDPLSLMDARASQSPLSLEVCFAPIVKKIFAKCSLPKQKDTEEAGRSHAEV